MAASRRRRPRARVAIWGGSSEEPPGFLQASRPVPWSQRRAVLRVSGPCSVTPKAAEPSEGGQGEPAAVQRSVTWHTAAAWD